MSSEENGGALGYLFMFFIGAALLIAFIIYVVIPTLLAAMGAGVAVGGGTSVYNYFKSFMKNVGRDEAEDVED